MFRHAISTSLKWSVLTLFSFIGNSSPALESNSNLQETFFVLHFLLSHIIPYSNYLIPTTALILGSRFQDPARHTRTHTHMKNHHGLHTHRLHTTRLHTNDNPSTVSTPTTSHQPTSHQRHHTNRLPTNDIPPTDFTPMTSHQRHHTSRQHTNR